MGTPVQAGEPELVALERLVVRERADLPPDGVPVSLLRDLMVHIRCDRISVTGMDGAVIRAFPEQVAV